MPRAKSKKYTYVGDGNSKPSENGIYLLDKDDTGEGQQLGREFFGRWHQGAKAEAKTDPVDIMLEKMHAGIRHFSPTFNAWQRYWER